MVQAQHCAPSGGEGWCVERLPPGSLYGEALRSRASPGLALSERRYAPFFRTPKHTHEHALLCLVVRGGYTETFGARIRMCEPPLLIFHPADEVHMEQFHQAGGRLFIIELEPKWLERVRDQAQIIEEAAEFRSGDLVYLVLSHETNVDISTAL